MKLNKFLLSAIAAASLTACSDSPEIVDNNKGHWNADGTGYVCLSISMPNSTSNGTRADADNTSSTPGSKNDDFEYGEDKEYAVNNAILLIFTAPEGTTSTKPAEDTFTFEAAYDMTTNFIKDDAGQIGATSKVTQKINQIADDKIAKALVILNAPSGVDNAITVDGTKLKIKGSEFSGTFSDFKKATDELPTEVAKGFTMTNAPLTTAQSTSSTAPSGSTSTLANIDKTKILPTQEQASTQPASTIYVERSVAKVTVNNNITTTKPLPENSNFNIEIKGFALNNTNKESYIVRNVENSWETYVSKASSVSGYDDKYRFVGYKEPITFNGGNHYRTYWAKDPNYDSDATTLKKELPTEWENTFGEKHPLYCLENTFDVVHQMHKNTTRVIVQAEIKDKDNSGNAETLYMWNNDAKKLANINAFKTTTTAGSAVQEANKIFDVIATGKTIKEIGLSDSNKGYVTVSSITFEDGTNDNSSDVFNAVKKYFDDIAEYKDGKVYYAVLIKHFGDRLTPWNVDEWGTDESKRPQSGDVNAIYPNTNRENNYLGRYGVVRNNWYEINLNKINKIGTPDIDYDKETPDDELNSYISVSINILSWAKRSQDVDLQ